ncbi:MAG: hypothetical protein ACRDD1_20380 [Planctomycetia bacterium]
MEVVLRKSRMFVVSMFLCAAGFLLFTVFIATANYIEETRAHLPDADPLSRPKPIPSYVLAPVLGGVGLMSVACVYAGVAASKGHLKLFGTSIEWAGAYRKELGDATSATRVQWRTGPQATIHYIFRPTMTIDLTNYDDADRLKFIEWLRRSVPEDRQEDWPEFCRHTAAPLRRRVDLAEGRRVLDPATEVMRSRGGIDRQYLVAAPIVLVVVTGLWWATGIVLPFAALPVLAVIWLIARSQIPKQGLVRLRRPKDEEGLQGKTIFAFLMMFSFFGLPAYFVLSAMRILPFSAGQARPFEPYRLSVFLVFFAVGLVGFLVSARRQKERRNARWSVERREAFAEWENGRPSTDAP